MALVLKRNLRQGVRLGDDIYVEIIRISNRSVSLRIVTPEEVRISRFELPSLKERVRRLRKEEKKS